MKISTTLWLLLFALVIGASVKLMTVVSETSACRFEYQPTLTSEDEAYCHWLSDRLKEIEAIKAGTKRAELLKLFKEDNNLPDTSCKLRTWLPDEQIFVSSKSSKCYTLKACPVLYTDVEFYNDNRTSRIKRRMVPHFRNITSQMIDPASDKNLYHWLDKRIKEARSIKEGMSRADLMQLFFEDSGLQCHPPDRYVLRRCTLLQVMVQFYDKKNVPESLPFRWSQAENEALKIKTVSDPYLSWGHSN